MAVVCKLDWYVFAKHPGSVTIWFISKLVYLQKRSGVTRWWQALQGLAQAVAGGPLANAQENCTSAAKQGILYVHVLL